MKLNKARVIFFTVIIFTVLMFTGCDRREGDIIDYEIVSMTINPATLYADDSDNTYADVSVFVEDEDGYPAQGIAVSFESDLGFIPGKIYTNDTGIAVTQFNDDGIIGMAHIIASTNEGGTRQTWIDSIEIKKIPDPLITSMTVSPRYLYADNVNSTYSEIRVTTEDEDGYATSGIAVNFESSLGFIPSIAITNEDGIATTQFHDNGVVGIANIFASVSDGGANQTWNDSIEIKNIPDVLITSMVVSPSFLYADNEIETYSNVRVTIEDEDGYATSGIAVNFESSIGYIPSIAITNEDGIATTQFHDNGVVGIANIFASVSDGGANQTWQDSVDIQEVPHLIITRIDTHPDTIYLDNGITYSEIKVWVSDNSNIPASGESVYFNCDIGDIIAHAYTDSTGKATTTLWDSGETGTAHVNVFVGDSDSTVSVEILPQPSVSDLNLNIPNNVITVNQVLVIEAYAENQFGPVPNGTEIIFTTELGNFQISNTDYTYLGKSVYATTSFGTARAFLYSGTQSGVGFVSASIDEDGFGTMLIDSENLTVGASQPSQMELSVHMSEDPNSPIVNEILLESPLDVYVLALVKDTYGNSVGGNKNVMFETDIGYIELNAQTDNSGIATATFSTGIQSGVAHISAECDSASAATALTIISTEVNSIQFANQQQVTIDIQGTGGDETAELSVNLYDGNGNSIDDTVRVWFNFQDRPEGPYPEGSNINNLVYNLSDSTSVLASNGVAVVSVNSGVEAGIIRIKAWCKNSFGPEIYAVKSNIIIQAGPPQNCQFTIAGDDNGEDMGAGMWKSQISALITDEWGNPVADGTVVHFFIDDSIDYASVVASNAYVGNENTNGDTLEGTAFSFIHYDGIYTNETVPISVDVGGTVNFNGNLVLPLQFGEINMICTPIHIELGSEGDPDPTEDDIICNITVKDGQQNRISNQRIMMYSSLGEPTDNDILPTYDVMTDEIIDEFSFFDDEDFNGEGDPFDGFTGWIPFDIEEPENGGELGRLQKNVTFYWWECPPPGMTGPGQANATIYANIFGSDTTVSVTITIFRYNN